MDRKHFTCDDAYGMGKASHNKLSMDPAPCRAVRRQGAGYMVVHFQYPGATEPVHPDHAGREPSVAETGERSNLCAFLQGSLLLCIQLDGERGDIFFQMGDRTGAGNQDHLG